MVGGNAVELPYQLPSGNHQLQINLAIDAATPTPYETATAKVGAGSLALQGETVPQARGSAPRNPCSTANSAIFQRAAGVVEQRQPSYGRAVAPVQPQMMLGIVGRGPLDSLAICDGSVTQYS